MGCLWSPEAFLISSFALTWDVAPPQYNFSLPHPTFILTDTKRKKAATSNPVYGDSFHSSQTIGDDVLSPCLVSLWAANFVEAHVGPIDCVISWENKMFRWFLQKRTHISLLLSNWSLLSLFCTKKQQQLSLGPEGFTPLCRGDTSRWWKAEALLNFPADECTRELDKSCCWWALQEVWWFM